MNLCPLCGAPVSFDQEICRICNLAFEGPYKDLQLANDTQYDTRQKQFLKELGVYG